MRVTRTKVAVMVSMGEDEASEERERRDERSARAIVQRSSRVAAS